MTDMKVFIQFMANAAGLKSEIKSSQTAFTQFASKAKSDFEGLRYTLRRVEGQLAGIGVTIGITKQIMDSARLDKRFLEIGHDVGASREQMQAFRQEAFGMAKQTGQSVDVLVDGFKMLTESGANLAESRDAIRAINEDMAITGVRAEVAADAIINVRGAFNLDLGKKGQSLAILEKMVVAAREGRANQENLATIMNQVGVQAAKAGLSLDQTLGLIETLSTIEKNPRRLGTLVAGTLMSFTDIPSIKQAQHALHFKFFNKDESLKDFSTIMGEMRRQYGKLTTDKAQMIFVRRVFGAAGQAEMKAIQEFLRPEALSKMESVTKKSADAAHIFAKELPDAVNTAVARVGMLKATLREAADGFAKPVKDAVTGVIGFGLAKKEDFGLELSGKQIIGGGAALVGGTVAAALLGNKLMRSLVKPLIGTGAGVAEGKALEYAAGVTPVFVVNWPGNMAGAVPLVGGAAAASLGGGLLRGAGFLLSRATLLGATAYGAYSVTSQINEALGNPSGKLGTLLYDILHARNNPEIKNNIDIRIDQEGRAFVASDNREHHVVVQTRRGSFLVGH